MSHRANMFQYPPSRVLMLAVTTLEHIARSMARVCVPVSKTAKFVMLVNAAIALPSPIEVLSICSGWCKVREVKVG